MSDRELLRLVREGEPGAFALLHRRYAARLHAVVRSQTSLALLSCFDPEDVVQEAFLSLFLGVTSGRCEVREGEDLWGLLVVITLNRLRSVASWHRAARRDVRRTLDGALSDRLARSVQAPDVWPRVELRLLTDDVLSRLSPVERQVAELRIEGHDVSGIASRVRTSRRTVERVLHWFRELVRASCLAADVDPGRG